MTALYVAGSSREIARCEAAIAYARSLDCVVTYDWTADIRAHLAAGKTDADLTDHQLQRHVLADSAAIARAHVVVLLVPAPEVATTGMWWEGGEARAQHKPIVVSRERSGARRCVFEVYAHTVSATDAAAITVAKHLATPRAMEAGR